MQEHLKTAGDASLGFTAITSPAWYPLLQAYVTPYMLIGGALLLTLRIGLAIRDYLRK